MTSSTEHHREGSWLSRQRIWTVPNVVTLARLCCIPVFVVLLFRGHHTVAAGFVLGTLGATDWVDGYVARHFDQVSELGKIIDPVADRILVATAVVSTVAYGAVPLWFGLATVLREVVVSVAVLVLASLGAARIDVLWVGKAGTFALMTSYPFFLFGSGHTTANHVCLVVAWSTGIVGLVLAWVAALSYIAPARAALIAGQSRR